MTIELKLEPHDGPAFVAQLLATAGADGFEATCREDPGDPAGLGLPATAVVTVAAGGAAVAAAAAEEVAARLVGWLWGGLARFFRNRDDRPATIRITVGEVIIEVTVPADGDAAPADLLAAVVDVLATSGPATEGQLPPMRRRRIS